MARTLFVGTGFEAGKLALRWQQARPRWRRSGARPRCRTFLHLLSYLGLSGWGLLWFIPGFRQTQGVLDDWQPFEVGARTLVHWHDMKVWSTPALHLYAGDTQLQIGPPPLVLIAPFERFRPYSVALGFGIAMVLAGVVATALVARLRPDRASEPSRSRSRSFTFVAQLAVVALWSHEVGFWRHLDDTMAIVGICIALRLCQSHGPWWLIGMVLGTSVAAKPWAVVAVPLLLGVRQDARAKASLATLASAALWWLPFVVAAPGTISALADYHIFPDPGSVLFLAHVRGNVAGWLRPAQFVLGAAAAYAVARRKGWVAAPLAGIAVRVLTDPYAFSYYAMAPLVFALAYDFATKVSWPRWTASVVLVEYGIPELGSSYLDGAAKLVWSTIVLLVLLRIRPRGRTSRDTRSDAAGRARMSPVRPLKSIGPLAEASAVIEPHGRREGAHPSRDGVAKPGDSRAREFAQLPRPAPPKGGRAPGHHQARLT